MSTPPHNAHKRAEFARLFDLFNRLVNHRTVIESRPNATGDRTRASLAIPAEITPIIRNLAKEKTQQGDKEGATPVTIHPGDSPLVLGLKTENENIGSVCREPADTLRIGRRYPFTFKMMLHTLYGLEEWRKKVKEVVERSQRDFKSLSEMDWKKSSVDMSGTKVVRGWLKQESRTRSISVMGVGDTGRHSRSTTNSGDLVTNKKKRRGSGVIQPTPQANHMIAVKWDQEGTRAIKKRCVGRSKSIDTSACGVRSTWVYDSMAGDVRGRASESAVSGVRVDTGNLSKPTESRSHPIISL
ncbi:hypothetical protein AMATHDRAFT_47400 [Amanita thiersii Skay4041]|uniref:Uncharacterized protein n=1 Tax=Amanita thiersii Skay4041 TaxID=703135 RepID=A0A2A9NTG5_9AGAR|nr:hypothetical protein AMATHDRAFT_47400 [Amanita thiersii Skay4041]